MNRVVSLAEARALIKAMQSRPLPTGSAVYFIHTQIVSDAHGIYVPGPQAIITTVPGGIRIQDGDFDKFIAGGKTQTVTRGVIVAPGKPTPQYLQNVPIDHISKPGELPEVPKNAR